MRLGLFFFLAAIPLIEIALLVKVGQAIGTWWTLAIVLASAFAGMYVLHRQGFAVMQRTMEAMAAGKPPVGPMVDGAFLMLAGLLLITPGLMTDVMALLLLIPVVRHRVAAWSVRKVLRSAYVRTSTFSTGSTTGPWPGQRPNEAPQPDVADPAAGPVIDGEFERVDERTVDARRQGYTNGSRPAAGDRQ